MDDFEKPPTPGHSNSSMVVVMGVTGAGKSYFINKLVGKEVAKEGNDLHPCTQGCEMIPVTVGNTKTLLIDTPGFDDSTRSDSQILNEIAKLLAAQYTLGFELKGIIYVHRITDIRYSGSAVKTFEILKRICGKTALSNVLLVTSRWSEVDEATGATRERQLRNDFWAFMLGYGSKMARFHGDHTSSVALISQLLVKETIVLRLQHEMISEGKNLHQTEAGSYLDVDLGNLRKDYLQQLEALEKLRKEVQDKDRAMRRKVQLEIENGQKNLRETEDRQATLRTDIVGDVRNEIHDGVKPKSRSFKKILPFISPALSLLAMFVGIPPMGTELFTS